MTITRIVQLTQANTSKIAREMVGTMGLVPLRAPHHSASPAAMADECRLAIGGVMYLEDAGEFKRGTIAAIARCLRQGSKNGPAIIAVDARSLESLGLAENVSPGTAVRHQKRINEVLAALVDGALAYEG